MCYYVQLNKNSKFSKQTMELVDEGSWTLWLGSSHKNKTIKYALSTGKKYYLLDRNGWVISIELELLDFKREKIARFTELNTQPCT